MSLIYIPERKIRADFKPDFPVELNPADPLSAKVADAWYFGGSPNSSMSGRHDGSFVGTLLNPAIDIQGRTIKGAYGANGNYFNVPYSPDLAFVNNFAFEVLCRPIAFNTTGFPYISGLLSNYDVSAPGPYLRFNPDATVGNAAKPVFGIISTGSTEVTAIGNNATAGAIVHLMGTYDGAAVRLYQNGVLIASTALTGNVVAAAVHTAIGSDYVSDTANLTRLFNGHIYYARIWKQAPTAAEVAQIYKNAFAATVRPKQRDLYLVVNTGIITIGQPAETDIAQPVATAKSQAIGLNTESDAAQTVSAVKTLAIGQVAESDAVQPVTAIKTAALGQVSESDVAQPLVFGLSAAIGQAVETESAPAVVAAKSAVIGQASETDTAQALVFGLSAALGQVAETDSAQAIAVAKTLSTGMAAETDAPLAVSPVKAVTLGQATEAESVAAITVAKSAAIGQVTETGTAPALVGSISIALGIVTETEFAQAIAYYKTLGMLQTVETGSAHAVTAAKVALIGVATETDSVAAIGLVGGAITNMTATLSDATVYAGLTDATIYAGLTRTRNY